MSSWQHETGGKSYRPYEDGDDDDDEVEDDEEEEEEEEIVATAELVETEDEEEEESEDEEKEEPARKRPKSLAFAYLQGQTFSPTENSISNRASSILQSLWDNQKESDADVSTALSIVAQEQAEREDEAYQSLRVVSDSSVSDFAVVSLTKHSNHPADQWSFLASFLATIDYELTKKEHAVKQVPVRHLIKNCCLSVSPQHVPASLDAEEMAMAALEFLSSSLPQTGDKVFPRLPLIRPVKEENDIKKRSYVKVGNWKWSSLSSSPTWCKQLRALEDVFLNDASSYKWLRRGAFVPPSLTVIHNSTSDDQSLVLSAMKNNNDLDQLLRKGKHKVVAAPKRKVAKYNKDPN